MAQKQQQGARAETRESKEARRAREAAVHEALIKAEADAIWGEQTELTTELFTKLYPLLTRPIPAGYVETIGVTEGKPYVSTGVRSVQVQHDRMNNVLRPWNWREEIEYLGHGEEGSKGRGSLCQVTVIVGGLNPTIGTWALARSARGGVDRGSSTGNVYKGSYTNAAKVAFARVGPGHEIYVGVADLDPDVSVEIAKAQARPEQLPETERIGWERAAQMTEMLKNLGVETSELRLKLGTLGVPVPEGATVSATLSTLTKAQGAEVDSWLSEKADAATQAEAGEEAQADG